MYEPGDIFAGADMTRYELATLDRLMFEAQQVGGAAASLLQFAVTQFGHGVGEGEFCAAAFIDIAVEQPGHRVVDSHAPSPQLSEL